MFGQAVSALTDGPGSRATRGRTTAGAPTPRGADRRFQRGGSGLRDTNADDEHDPEGATIAFERSQVAALAQQVRDHLADYELVGYPLEELRNHVAVKIGAIAKPANIVFTPELPKTRSGKIMRRLLRDVAEHRALGDTTTLADPAVCEEIAQRATEIPTED